MGTVLIIAALLLGPAPASAADTDADDVCVEIVPTARPDLASPAAVPFIVPGMPVVVASAEAPTGRYPRLQSNCPRTIDVRGEAWEPPD